jgi:hypothetical protein
MIIAFVDGKYIVGKKLVVKRVTRSPIKLRIKEGNKNVRKSGK